MSATEAGPEVARGYPALDDIRRIAAEIPFASPAEGAQLARELHELARNVANQRLAVGLQTEPSLNSLSRRLEQTLATTTAVLSRLADSFPRFGVMTADTGKATIQTGIVMGVAEGGAYIDLGQGRQGFLSLSDREREHLRVGDEVIVEVRELGARGEITLSHVASELEIPEAER